MSVFGEGTDKLTILRLRSGSTLPLSASNCARNGASGPSGYMWNHLWVTPYDREQNWPAGKYPNQHAGGAGLPEWTSANRSVENTDIVLWYVMGHNHLPSLEDWPVMPVASIGFTLKPSGFFDQSPAMDLPASSTCHPQK